MLLSSRSVGAIGPADRPREREGIMSELKLYEVTVNGWPTTLQLTAADAAARGLTDDDTVEHRANVQAWLKAEEAAERERLAAEQAEAERKAAEQAVADAPAAHEEAPAKARTPANKSRTAANKGA